MESLYAYLTRSGWLQDGPNTWSLRLPPVPFEGDVAKRQALFKTFIGSMKAQGWTPFDFNLDVTGELSISLGPQSGVMLSLSSYMTDSLDTVLVLEVTDPR